MMATAAITRMMIAMILSPSTLMAMALSTAQTQHQRDILVVTRGRVDIPSEVRALAQCATAALHLQTGMRQNTKLWLSLPIVVAD